MQPFVSQLPQAPLAQSSRIGEVFAARRRAPRLESSGFGPGREAGLPRSRIGTYLGTVTDAIRTVTAEIETRLFRGGLLMLVTELLSERAERKARRDWWRAAACRAADPDIFFPVSAQGPGREEIAQAKAVCAGCPVRRQCLQFALATHQVHGVWGGTTEEERRLHMDTRPAVPAQRGSSQRAASPALYLTGGVLNRRRT